ncbi:MAG: YybH family protein [Gemmatimonadales bacterium]
MRLLLPATTLALLACAPQPEQPDLAAEEQAIRDLDRRWVDAVALQDTMSIADIYAVDGYFMPANAARIDGRDAIRSAWAELFQESNLSLTFQPTEIVVAQSADMAYDIGTYSIGMDGPEGRIEDEGKYVVVWKKVNGEWKVAADIFNSNKPVT